MENGSDADMAALIHSNSVPYDCYGHAGAGKIGLT
jgi:hypothetical protein